MKRILLFVLLSSCLQLRAQYIGVKARYTETRLVPNPGFPVSRENRLMVSFYTVIDTGVYTPAVISNQTFWIWKTGLQIANIYGGILDSSGHNYPGYSFTAPRAIAYFNTYGDHHVDCDPSLTVSYLANGHEIDFGFVEVSHWIYNDVYDRYEEQFTAPNIFLPYYQFPHPYAIMPGNANFGGYPAGESSGYTFFCAGPSQQWVYRGEITHNSDSSFVILPVRFAGESITVSGEATVSLSWSNMTESDVLHYEVQRALPGGGFETISTITPALNDGSRADYTNVFSQASPQIYYRIKAFEYSGAAFYSKVLYGNLETFNQTREDQNKLTVFPNPVVHSNFQFQLSQARKGRYISTVVTAEGKQLKRQLIMHNGGNLPGQVDLSGIPAGMYQFVLTSDNETFTKKIILIR